MRRETTAAAEKGRGQRCFPLPAPGWEPSAELPQLMVQRVPVTQPASAFSISPGLMDSYSFPFQYVLGRTSDGTRENFLSMSKEKGLFLQYQLQHLLLGKVHTTALCSSIISKFA